MTISWYGEACFLIEDGGVRILTTPPSKESGLPAPRLKTDIMLFSGPGSDNPPTGGDGFVISGPGEYEVKNIGVSGIADGANTLYVIESNGLKVAYLGFLGRELDGEKLEELKSPDIVLVPVGGGGVLDAETAMNLINKIEPSVAVPMLFSVKGLKIKRAPIGDFLKESGVKDASPLPKLSVKKKDLLEEKTKITILDAS